MKVLCIRGLVIVFFSGKASHQHLTHLCQAFFLCLLRHCNYKTEVVSWWSWLQNIYWYSCDIFSKRSYSSKNCSSAGINQNGEEGEIQISVVLTYFPPYMTKTINYFLSKLKLTPTLHPCKSITRPRWPVPISWSFVCD